MVETFSTIRQSTPFIDLLQRLGYYSEATEYCEKPLVINAMKLLYERQNGVELIDPSNHDKIMTCKELCEKCNIDTAVLESELLGKYVSPLFFEKYQTILDGEDTEAIKLLDIGIGWTEEHGYVTKIKKKLSSKSERGNNSQTLLRPTTF
jgi:hypothetical protein